MIDTDTFDKTVDAIKRVHRDACGRYGSPRIHAELKTQGRGTSRGRIERLMRRHGIRAIMARPRPVRTTDSHHDFPIAPNLLERNFIATAPNRIWLADITYIETDQGWLYLATVMDLYSRKIVGWAMADHLRADLPLAALRVAISAQRPGAGLIHHSDRGVQYASADYRKLLQSAGFRASMRARPADCREHVLAIVRSRAYFDRALLAEALHGRIAGGLLHHPKTVSSGNDRGRGATARSRVLIWIKPKVRAATNVMLELTVYHRVPMKHG